MVERTIEQEGPVGAPLFRGRIHPYIPIDSLPADLARGFVTPRGRRKLMTQIRSEGSKVAESVIWLNHPLLYLEASTAWRIKYGRR